MKGPMKKRTRDHAIKIINPDTQEEVKIDEINAAQPPPTVVTIEYPTQLPPPNASVLTDEQTTDYHQPPSAKIMTTPEAESCTPVVSAIW